MTFLSNLPNDGTKNNIIGNSLWGLTRTDPARAYSFVMEQMTGRDRDEALGQVVDVLARRDPGQVIQIIDSLPYGRAYENAVNRLARQWGSNDPIAAIEWVQSLEDGPEKLTDPQVIRNDYLNAFEEHRQAVKKILAETMVDYQSVTTDDDMGTVLSRFLVARAPKKV